MIQEEFINWLVNRKDYIMGLFDSEKAKDKGLELILNKLNQDIATKTVELNSLNKQLQIANELQTIDNQIQMKKSELLAIEEEINLANDTLELQEFGFFERRYNFSDSTRYKDALDTLRMGQKDMVKNGRAGENY